MSQQLDNQSAKMLCKYLKKTGVESRTNSGVQTLLGDDEGLHHVILKGGEMIKIDIFLICAGISPNTTLAQHAGLNVNHGIVVNAKMETSHEHIYAVGDVAELSGSVGGLWAVGNAQGKIAAENINGKNSQYQAEMPPPIQLKINGIDLRSFGQIKANEGDILITNEDKQLNLWLSIVVNKGMIMGGVFVNAATQANSAMLASKTKMKVSDFIEDLKKGDWSNFD